MSKTITEPEKQIDVIHETDVLVVGSGPWWAGRSAGRRAHGRKNDPCGTLWVFWGQHHYRRVLRGLRGIATNKPSKQAD
jgi:hypothetical protein